MTHFFNVNMFTILSECTIDFIGEGAYNETKYVNRFLARQGEKNMDQQLYRQKSIDRISSPEQLNDYLRVTNVSVWVILAAVIILLAGLLVWSSIATIESYTEGSAQVQNGVMTIRFHDQKYVNEVEKGMPVRAGDTETVISSIGRDDNGLLIATANTTLADGVYPVRISYKQTQVLDLLFN